MLNEQGRVIYRIKPPEKARPAGAPEKQIDALVGYLKDFAAERGCACGKLWLEPMKRPKNDQKPGVSDYEQRPYVLNPFVGYYDDLQNQKHRRLCVSLTNGGNVIVYGSSGSGKLSFINRFMYSLVSEHTAEEVKIYALDFDSGSLTAFDSAPHVGGIVLSGDCNATQAVLDDVMGELERRRDMFRRYGGDYQNFVRCSEKTVPNIVLIISNYMAFTEEFSLGEEMVAKIAREGKKYGIFVVLTAIAAAVRYSLVPLFSNLYVLQQNNEDQYSTILGKTGGIVPSKYRGRGILKINETTYEFQTSIVFEESENTYEAISAYCTALAESCGVVKKELPVMPKCVTRTYFEDLGYPMKPNAFPAAVCSKTKKPLLMNFSASKLTVIASDEENRHISDCICSALCDTGEIGIVIGGVDSDDENAIALVEHMVYERADRAGKALDAGEVAVAADRKNGLCFHRGEKRRLFSDFRKGKEAASGKNSGRNRRISCGKKHRA